MCDSVSVCVCVRACVCLSRCVLTGVCVNRLSVSHSKAKSTNLDTARTFQPNLKQIVGGQLNERVLFLYTTAYNYKQRSNSSIKLTRHGYGSQDDRNLREKPQFDPL